jgi:hypothetical protein
MPTAMLRNTHPVRYRSKVPRGLAAGGAMASAGAASIAVLLCVRGSTAAETQTISIFLDMCNVKPA